MYAFLREVDAKTKRTISCTSKGWLEIVSIGKVNASRFSFSLFLKRCSKTLDNVGGIPGEYNFISRRLGDM